MSEIGALLSLLEDPDPSVREPLLDRLTQDRELLDRAWLEAECRGDTPEALVGLVIAADADDFIDVFAAAEDLEQGCWLLPRLDHPRRDYAIAGARALDALAARLPERCDGGEIATFLCGECGFAGDARDYHDPQNSYLPQVLERRLGLPITLTALWMLIGRRRNLELNAIALPRHVVGRWAGGYVDLFAGGRMLRRDELDRHCRDAGAAGAAAVQTFLTPASDRALLRRMARNLVTSYVHHGDKLRATTAHGLAST